jgi:hypothetical protein
MEVHHHPHLASGETHTARKKWTHYFWEFLMLFLAVFCGFLAEYQLEHVIEKNREKQYIRSFVDDLIDDALYFDGAIDLRASRARKCDSLIMLLKSPDREKHTSTIYLLGLQLSYANRFSRNDRTIQQLRNAGGMRLIRAKGASDSIITYDIYFRRMQLDEDQSLEILKEYRIAATKIFDASVFQTMIDTTGNKTRIVKPADNVKLLAKDPEAINSFCTQVFFYRRSNETINNATKSLLVTANRMSRFLEEQYHLSASGRTPLEK